MSQLEVSLELYLVPSVTQKIWFKHRGMADKKVCGYVCGLFSLFIQDYSNAEAQNRRKLGLKTFILPFFVSSGKLEKRSSGKTDGYFGV